MKKFQRPIPFLALMLGLLGIVVSLAATVVVWSVGSQLSQTNESVFDGIDKSLEAIRNRVLDAQRRVQESKITTEEIGQSVSNWTRKEASERLTSRFEVEEKSGKLALGLRQADLWLEMSGASIQGVQQALEMGSSLGAPVDPALVDPLLEKLGALRRQLKQSTETIDEIRERMAKTAEDEALETRISQVAQLARRVVATLSEIDSRLGESADSLAGAQTKGQHLKTKTHSYIVTAEICAVIFIAWMAAGQVSLCRHGWKDYRQFRSTA